MKKENAMKLDDLKFSDVLELRKQMADLFGGAPVVAKTDTETHSFVVGKNYFIRTVTHHYTGKLVSVTDSDLVLVDAAWIADDGRFAQAITDGKFGEVEPYPDGLPVIINRGALVDACEIGFALPRTQK